MGSKVLGKWCHRVFDQTRNRKHTGRRTILALDCGRKCSTCHNIVVAQTNKIACPTYHNCSILVHYVDEHAALIVTQLLDMRTKLFTLSQLQHFCSLCRQKCSTCHDIVVANTNKIVPLITTAAFLFTSLTKMQHLSRHYRQTWEQNCPTYLNCSVFVHFLDENAALVTTLLLDMGMKCPIYHNCCIFVRFGDENAALVMTLLLDMEPKLFHLSQLQHFRSLW